MLPYNLLIERHHMRRHYFLRLNCYMGGQLKDQQEILAMTGEDVEKSVIEHVINVSERLSEMRDIVGENLLRREVLK